MYLTNTFIKWFYGPTHFIRHVTAGGDPVPLKFPCDISSTKKNPRRIN